jgi:hypothetical protein
MHLQRGWQVRLTAYWLTSSQVLTGSYHNYFRIYDVNGDNDVVLQADKSAFKAKKIGGARGKVPGKKEGLQTEGIDFSKKIVSLVRVKSLTNSFMEAGILRRIRSRLPLPTICKSNCESGLYQFPVLHALIIEIS